MSGARKPDDPTGSGEIQQRPAPGGPDDRDLHHEGVPDEPGDSKGGPPHDDRLSGETAHTRQSGDQPD